MANKITVSIDTDKTRQLVVNDTYKNKAGKDVQVQRIKFELGVTNMLYNPKLKQIKLIDLAEGEVGWDGVFNRFEAFVRGLVV